MAVIGTVHHTQSLAVFVNSVELLLALKVDVEGRGGDDCT